MMEKIIQLLRQMNPRQLELAYYACRGIVSAGGGTR